MLEIQAWAAGPSTSCKNARSVDEQLVLIIIYEMCSNVYNSGVGSS